MLELAPRLWIVYRGFDVGFVVGGNVCFFHTAARQSEGGKVHECAVMLVFFSEGAVVRCCSCLAFFTVSYLLRLTTAPRCWDMCDWGLDVVACSENMERNVVLLLRRTFCQVFWMVCNPIERCWNWSEKRVLIQVDTPACAARGGEQAHFEVVSSGTAVFLAVETNDD